MLGLDVRRDLRHLDPATATSLAALETGLARVWPDLRTPVVHFWSDDLVVGLDHGRAFVWGPIEQDPLALDGRTVVPRAQLRELGRLADKQVPFQRFMIAHELDPDGPVRDLLPELRHGPRRCANELAAELVGPVPVHPAVARTVWVLDALAGATSAAMRTGAEVLLDPLILGVIAPSWPKHGQPCLLYPAVAWMW